MGLDDKSLEHLETILPYTLGTWAPSKRRQDALSSRCWGFGKKLRVWVFVSLRFGESRLGFGFCEFKGLGV